MSYLPLLHSDNLSIFDDFFSGDRRRGLGKAVVPVEVESDDNYVYVRAEIPGIPKENIVIEYQDGVLDISGEKVAHTRQSEKGYYYTEVSTGKFNRKIQVGRDLKFANAEATYSDGVLHVTIPKEKQSPVNRLAIK
jgi:HSP20 family protein